MSENNIDLPDGWTREFPDESVPLETTPQGKIEESQNQYAGEVTKGVPGERAVWRDEEGKFAQSGEGRLDFTGQQIEDAREEMNTALTRKETIEDANSRNDQSFSGFTPIPQEHQDFNERQKEVKEQIKRDSIHQEALGSNQSANEGFNPLQPTPAQGTEFFQQQDQIAQKARQEAAHQEGLESNESANEGFNPLQPTPDQGKEFFQQQDQIAQEARQEAAHQEGLESNESANEGFNPLQPTPDQGKEFFQQQDQIAQEARLEDLNEQEDIIPERPPVNLTSFENSTKPTVTNMKGRNRTRRMLTPLEGDKKWAYRFGYEEIKKALEETKVTTEDGNIQITYLSGQKAQNGNPLYQSHLTFTPSQIEMIEETIRQEEELIRNEGLAQETEESVAEIEETEPILQGEEVGEVQENLDPQVLSTGERLGQINERIENIQQAIRDLIGEGDISNLSQEQLLEYARMTQEQITLLNERFSLIQDTLNRLGQDAQPVQEDLEPSVPPISADATQPVQANTQTSTTSTPQQQPTIIPPTGGEATTEAQQLRQEIADLRGENTPVQKLSLSERRFAQLTELRRQGVLTDQERIEYLNLLNERERLQKQIAEVEQEDTEKRKNRHKWVKVAAAAAGVTAGVLAPPLGAAAILGIALGGPIVGKQAGRWSEKLQAKARSMRSESRRGKSLEELAKLDKKIKRNQWWANRLGDISAGLPWATGGFLGGNFIGNAVRNIIASRAAASTAAESSLAGQQPTTSGSIEPPPTTQGTVEVPTAQGSTSVEALSDGVLVQNGRVNLPGSAWDGNLAQGPAQDLLTGGALNHSNYAGGIHEMAASALEKDLISHGIARSQLSSTLDTSQIHQLLNNYLNSIQAGNVQPSLTEALSNINPDAVTTLLGN